MGKRQFLVLLLFHSHVLEQCQAQSVSASIIPIILNTESPRTESLFVHVLLLPVSQHFSYKFLPQSCQASLLYKGIPRQCFPILGRGQLEVRWKPPIFVYFINNVIFVLALLLWCCISVSEKCLECCYSAPWGQWFGWSQDMHFSWELCTGKAFRSSHFQAGWIQQGKLWQHSLQHTQQLQYLAENILWTIKQCTLRCSSPEHQEHWFITTEREVH